MEYDVLKCSYMVQKKKKKRILIIAGCGFKG